MNLLFSYSSLPLYATAAFCLLASMLAMIMTCWVFINVFLYGVVVPGWASAYYRPHDVLRIYAREHVRDGCVHRTNPSPAIRPPRALYH